MPTPKKEVEEPLALETKPPPPYDGSHRYLKSEVAHLLAENQRLREALTSLAVKDNCWCSIAHWWTSRGEHSQRCVAIRAALNPPVSSKEK